MIYILQKFLAAARSLYTASVVLILAFALSFSLADSAIAIEISDAIRTVPLNELGEQTTLELEQLSAGQRKFNSSCVQCHLDGGSKTNPDVDLGPDTLARATPARNNLESIVDYLHHPTTYDGLGSLAEFHPSTENADLFPRMKALSENDLKAIAGYILAEPNIIGDQWAGGKPRR
ncbi:MAG: photosystem II cytochrome c-550 [Phormidesmis sp.]